MKATLQTQAQAPTRPSFTSLPPGFLQRKCACGGSEGLNGACEDCDKQKLSLQRRATSQSEPSAVPSVVSDVLRSPGQPLDSETRAFMEPRFGHNFSRVRNDVSRISQSELTVGPANDPLEREADELAENALRMPLSSRNMERVRADFSGVRIHADARAADSSSAVNAKAYTVGQDIVFGPGRYAPGTEAGRRLLAHELAHTVQQSRSGTAATAGLQRTIGDDHDLTSPRFSLLVDLEEAFDEETLIRIGSSGRGVQAIQQALYDLGFRFPTEGADGLFGPETEAAVRSYQAANPPLVVDGIVGKETMAALDARFGAVALPPAAARSAPWTQACVRSIVCPWSPHTIEVLRSRITLKSFDSISWADEEWDGAAWVLAPFPGAGYNTGTEIGVLNDTCEGMSETLYHEVLHAEQPSHHTTTLAKESYAYRIGEEFSIAMGLGGRPGLRSTDPQGRQFADPALVDASLAPGGGASYPGIPVAGGTEEILDRVGSAGQVRVRRADGTIYLRAAVVGEKVDGPITTVPDPPVTHLNAGWTCP